MMMKTFGLLAVLLLCVPSFAQHNTSSAYSMFGIGEVDTRTYGLNSGMAGAGIGMSRNNFLNSDNPAGVYIDSLLFVFDVSTALKVSEFAQGGSTARASNMNLKKIAFGFRVYPRWNIHFGLTPYSNVEYNLRTTQYVEGSNSTFENLFSGSGGLTKIYLSNAVKLTPQLSLGVKGAFLFGSMVRSQTTSNNYTDVTSTTSRFLADFGLQYNAYLNENMRYSLGATYSYKNKMTLKNKRYISLDNSISSLYLTHTYLPQTFGIGGFMEQIAGHRKWMYALDYVFENWNSKESPAPKVYYQNAHRINMGLQYTPNYRTPRNYFQKVSYQAGMFFNRSHLRIDGTPLQEAGVTLGTNLPLRNGGSVIFLSADFGWRGGKRLIDERFFLVTAGVSLSEVWFMKWVYD